jgi:hypothetical protein
MPEHLQNNLRLVMAVQFQAGTPAGGFRGCLLEDASALAEHRHKCRLCSSSSRHRVVFGI